MGHRSAIEIEDQSEPSLNDRVAREAIRLALDALKDVEPDNPYCSEHIEAAKLSLRTALRTLTQPA